MAITATTLSAAITSSQTQFALASTSAIVLPVSTTGAGSFLLVDREMMQVTGVPVSGTVQVVRGVNGTIASAHTITSGVLISATQADFPNFQPTVDAFIGGLPRYQGAMGPVASAATIAATGQFFHVTGGTAINIITPPTNFVEGEITIIFDSTCTWTSSAVTNGIAASGTSTVGASAVKFYYDAATSRWYPERLA